MQQELLTIEDIKELEAELEHLKVHGRAEMAEKIRIAREFGDLSENAEYDIAKDDQAKMEARIVDIEQKLRNAVVYEKTKSDKIIIGNTVKLLDVKTKEEITYEIVGSHQANPFEKKISVESPLGKALLNKKKGEEVMLNVRDGRLHYKVMKIS